MANFFDYTTKIQNLMNSINNSTFIQSYNLLADPNDSIQLSPEEVQDMMNSVNSDGITNELLEEHLIELKKINLTLKSQLNTANENLKKKDEIIFNQNIQIEQWKLSYNEKEYEAKKSKIIAVFSAGFALITNFDKISFFIQKIYQLLM